MKKALTLVLSVLLIDRPAVFSLSLPLAELDVRANPRARAAHPKLA